MVFGIGETQKKLNSKQPQLKSNITWYAFKYIPGVQIPPTEFLLGEPT